MAETKPKRTLTIESIVVCRSSKPPLSVSINQIFDRITLGIKCRFGENLFTSIITKTVDFSLFAESFLLVACLELFVHSFRIARTHNHTDDLK